MADGQRTLELILKVNSEALQQLQQQFQGLMAGSNVNVAINFGDALAQVRQLIDGFRELSGSTEDNKAAIDGAKVAKAAAQALGEQEKAAQQAAKAETERLKVEQQQIQVDQQAIKLEADKAKAIQATANAEAAQSRAKAAAIRTERLQNPPEKPDKPEKKEGGLFGEITGAIPELALVSTAFNQVTESIGKVGEFGKQIFEGLIAQVVEVRQQTLGIAANIASQVDISVDGTKITDPLKAIQAVLPGVQKGIEQLKQDSLDTTATTSELIPLYQTIAGKLNILGINTDQAEKLTIRLSQAAGGLNIPYQQAAQEIAGISNGEITVYNQLARSIGLNQTRFQQLQAQGKLYDFILERTEALAAGQKLQAEQLPGLTSSIKDAFELITQAAGAPLLDAIIEPVKQFLTFLKSNQATFESAAKGITSAFVSVATGLIQPLVSQLQPSFAALGNAFQAVSKLFGDFSQNEGPVLGEYFGKLANLVGAVLNSALTTVINTFTNLVKIFDVVINNPIVQFIGKTLAEALGLIVDGVTGAIDAFSSFSNISANAFGGLFDVLSDAEKTVSKALEPLGKAFQEIQLIVGAVFGGIGNKIQSAFAPVLPIVKAIGAAIYTNLAGSVKAIGDTFNGVFDFVGRVTAKIRDIVGGIIDNPAFKAFAKLVGVNIEEVRAGLKKLNEEASADGLKKAGTDAEAAAKGFETSNKALDDLGKTSDLIKSQLAGAFKDLGNRDKAEDAAKRVVDLTQKALENGTISRQQAEDNLKAIQNNTGLQLDTRLNAEKALTKIIQDGGKEQLDAIKTRETEIQNAVKAGQLSQVEGEKELTAAKLEETDKQIDITRKALEREDAEGRGQGPRAAELRRQLEQQQSERTVIVEQGAKQRAQAELTGFDEQAKILEGRRSQGLVSEQDFANESLDITRKRINAEQKELERERSLLKPGDTAGQKAIDAKEAELNVKREKATEEFENRRVQIIERAQAKAIDAVKLAETQRNLEVDKLLAARQIRESEAGLIRTQQAQKTIAKELELERDRANQLEKLPKLSDPVAEEGRQAKIRASRLKTAELADSLVKNEIEQQQALFRVVSERLDRQAQAAQNAATAEAFPLQNQLKIQSALTAAIDNQNRLLEARKGLQDALSGYAQTEVSLLGQTAKTETEKKTVAELTAAIKLRALQQQQSFEQQSLENEIQKNKLAIENEKIQNRIAQIQSNAAVLKAQAELSKAKADPNATREGIEAAQAAVEAAKADSLGLQLQGLLIEQKGQTQDVAAGFDRQRLAIKQQGESDQGRAELINALPDSFKRTAELNFQQDLLKRSGLSVGSIGSVNTDTIRQAAIQPGGVGNFALPGVLNPVAQFATVQANPQIEALKQQLGRLLPTTSAIATPQQTTNNADSKAILAELQRISGAALRPIEAPVTQTVVNPDPKIAAQMASRQITDSLKRAFSGVGGRMQ